MTLEARGLRFTYAGWPPTLRGVDLRVEAGQCAFLLGPSGGGKSTALRCIAGLERSYEGEVLLDNARVDALPPHERGIGMLFQEPALFPHLPVWRNVSFGMRYHGLKKSEEPTQAREWLRLVDLSAQADSQVDELSGGQRQRVALARALAARPRAVLLDEPLSALDQALREELGTRIRETLARAKVPALWVTHDEEEARRLGDRAWRLVEGKAVPAW